MPLAATMRWQGMMSEKRLSAQNEPAARAAPGRPASDGELAVGDDLAPGDRARRRGELVLQRRCPVELERNVVIGRGHAAEVRGKPPAQIRHETGTNA